MTIFDITIFGLHLAPTYYGLMYALGFIISYYILKRRKLLDERELDALIIYAFFGVILGGRFGYVLFYDLGYYLKHPIEILETWKGGMSFHGGVIGMIIAMIAFSKRYKKNFFTVADEVVRILPIGLGLGRIGNYINKELLGIPYSGVLAVHKGGGSFFPSTLLEAFLEGIVLYFVIDFFSRKTRYRGQLGGIFLIFYALFRIFAELFRQPDVQLGYIFDHVTMGQILSLPMLLFGIYFYYFFKKYPVITKDHE